MAQPIEPRTIEPADLYRMRFLQGARLSPDGARVVYVVSHTDAVKDEEYSTIWVMDLGAGESRQFTAGLWRDGNPQWSPDGKLLAFVSTRGGAPQIYVMSTEAGEPKALTSAKKGVGAGPLWSPDGKFIAFTIGPEGEPRNPAKPYRVTRRIYRFDGMGYVDDTIQGIHIIPAEGGEAKRLAKTDYHQVPIAWSPDGREILFNASFFPQSSSAFPRLRLVNLDGRVREVVGEWGPAMAAAWTPDGKRIVFMGQPEGKLPGTKSDLWVTTPIGVEPRCRTAGLKVGVGGGLQPDMPVMALLATNICPIRDGTAAFVPVHEGGTLGISRVALDGPESWQPAVTGDRSCMLMDADDKHLYIVSTLNNPAELYVSNLDGSGEKRLTHINDELFKEFKLPATERLRFQSVDGVEVEAWVMKPPVGEPPYPTVLYTHGGPNGAWGHIFSFDFQMLAGAGYAVLFVNYRGSTGYGDEFATRLHQDWGNLDYQDSMAAVDYVIQKGLADPNRLGCCGISYGGFMSSWIVGQTDRFKAAVPENPVTNLVSLYGVGDVPEMCAKHMGGPPWEVPEVYRRCSPITYAHKCKTPTLLVQGEMDFRCPTEQSEQFYATLKASGCTVEMLRVPNSSHLGTVAGPLPGRKAQNEALLGWMNRHVLGVKPEGKQ